MEDRSDKPMRGRIAGIRVSIGCRLRYSFPQPTPLIAMLNVHYSRFGDLERADYLVTSPSVPLESYRDGFGNWCTRLMAPAGDFALSTDGIFRDYGRTRSRVPWRAAARCTGSAFRDPRVSAGQPVLRYRSSFGGGVASF
ncbi:hypothetical protein [Tateyamaria pelophila]|uniref:hypothetical protein n=1 Tax=Tateyamaria pelophila TaxID=328415 RepID=UPI001CBB6D31|nr:hypothetical protein [Tateyamaria pelophila]